MKTRVHLIDDNSTLTGLMAKALAKFGHEVVVENRPAEAMESVRRHMPDLIVLDAMTPGRHGGRLLRDLRGDFALRHIPVVLLSAVPWDAEEVARCGERSSPILPKPSPLKLLLETIDNELRASRDRRPVQDLAPDEAPAGSAPHPGMADLPDFDRPFPHEGPEIDRILIPPPSVFSDPRVESPPLPDAYPESGTPA